MSFAQLLQRYFYSHYVHSGLRVALGVLGLTLAACDEGPIQSDYSAAYTETKTEDADGDGYADDDCDDANSDRHPNATETPGDGVDSNCDGNDDT